MKFSLTKACPWLALLFVPLFAYSDEKVLGDVNGDGVINIQDFVTLVKHIQGVEYLSDTSRILQADANGDGLINSYDLEESMKYRFRRKNLPQLPRATVLNTSPYNGEADVALSREFVVHFSMPISDSNLSEIFSANVDFPLSAKLSGDGMKATLFLNGSQWPANSEISISLKIDALQDKIGRPFALNSESQNTSAFTWSFTTVATRSGDPSTSVSGYVFDSNYSLGERPLEGVIVSIPGNEENKSATTDSNGFFQLSGVPNGRFFVNVDGRNVEVPGEDNNQSWRDRSYYAFVGKAWEATLGKDSNATKYGTYDDKGRYIPDARDGRIYLPLVKEGALQVVDPTKETEIKFVDGYLEEANASVREMMAATSLTIPPGSLISDNGTPGGSVGIAPVPSDRLPEPLPPGLELPLVITIQTDGATNFDTPIPATFPNIDGLDPGAKSALWSFDHDKGKWEIAGPMTVSENGLFVSTDPGVGIRQPGWHGVALGAQIFGRGGFCGSPMERLNELARQATIESIGAVEGELKQFAQYASGIEESIFLSDRKLIQQSLLFAEGNGNPTWNELIANIGKLDSPQNQYDYATGVVQLINADNTWTELYGRADAIKKAAIHCANKKRIAGSQAVIQEAFNSFEEYLDTSKSSLRKQSSLYKDFAYAAEVIASHFNQAAPPDSDQFKKDILLYKRAMESLPAGRGGMRMDHQILQIIRNWHDFLNQGLTPYLTELTTNSFVYLKRIGSPAEELGPPPIASQRIRVGRGGSYDAIIRPDSVYEVWMLEPRRLQLGGTIFVSPPNGVNRRIANIPLAPDDLGDRDVDLLSDRAERVVGTDADNNDTDSDTLGDGFEVINGSDPNGGNPVFTGVIATAPTNHGGFSNRVLAENNLVFLGSQQEGIDCFDINGTADLPTLISEYKREQTNVRNFSYSNGWLAVAEGSGGITVIDYTDPGDPKTLANHATESPANAVSIAGGILYAGLENGAVLRMDALHGFVIDRMDYGSMIDDMTYLNGYLYFCHSNNPEVVKVEVNNGRFDHNNSVQLRSGGWKPWRGGRRLFVGENFAYATNYDGFSYFNFDTNQTSQIQTQSFGWRRMVANGSGLALSIEGLTSFGLADSSLYTVNENGGFLRGDDDYLENFEATFRTLGDAQDVSIYNGLAYVADGYEGLQVINYRAYEHQGGDSPQILSIHSNDQNGNVEESSVFTLSATVSDNVQVKYVEFSVNGNPTKTDGSYPFSIDYLAPRLADEQNFTTQIKVYDTGGNVAKSNVTTWTITQDQTPPVLIDIFPAEGSILQAGDTIMALFNEKLEPNDINESTVLFQEISNPNSPTLVADCNISYDDRLHAIFITLPDYLPPGQYLLTLDKDIADSLGNSLGEDKNQTFVGPSEIHGSIWFDSNHDRVWGGTENELAGWTVFADLDYNGELSDGEPNATSDENGEYQLVNLLPGQYSVNEIIPYSWVQTFPKSNPVDEMAPTRGFEISGTLYQTSWPVQQNHVVDAMNQHFTISQSSNLSGDGYNKLILQKYAPNGILLKEIDVFEQNETTNTRISISSGLTSPILHLSTRNSDQSFETQNFEEKHLYEIEFKVGDIENNASYDITLAHLLDANLESTTEFGINEYSEHLHEHIVTQVSPAGKLYVAGLLDGNLSIGGQLINETDVGFSLLVARTDEFLNTEFVVTNSLEPPSLNSFYEGEHILDFQFQENGKFLVSQSFGNSGTSYYLFAADGNLTESFLMPEGNNLDGLQKLAEHGFISGWQTYKDDSGNTLAIPPYNYSSGKISSLPPNWDMFKGAGFEYKSGNEEFWFYSAESNYSDSFSVSVTGFDAFPDTAPNFAISPSGDSLWIWRSGLRRASYTPQILARSESSSDRQIYKIGALSDSYISRFSKNRSYSWSNVVINLEEIIDGSRSRMSSRYLSQYPTNDLLFLRALNRSFFPYYHRYWWDQRDDDFDHLKDEVEEDLSVSFLSNYSDTGRLRVGSVIDHNKHPNLGFQILQCKPAENNHGVWVLGVLSGEPSDEKVQLGGSAIDVSSLPKTVAIRIGGSTPDNHLVNLPENSVLADVNFGNALEKEEIKSLESFGGAQNDFSTDLVSDNLGNSFLSGSITNTVDFNQTELNASATDGILAKYTEDGKLEWQVILGGDGNDSIQALTADGMGGVYATGSYEGNMTLSNGQTLHSYGNHDVYALHLDENGSVTWAQSYGGFGNDAGTALHFHSAGGKDTLLLGGYFEQILAFGDRYLAAEGNGTNGFIAELNSTDGELINATAINTEGNATIQSVLLDSSQRIVAGGDISTSLKIWDFMDQPIGGEIFHADFNGSLGDLTYSSGNPSYVPDRAGFADRALGMGTDANLTWSAENNQSDFPFWTLTTWLKAESNDTVLDLGNDLEISIQWGEQDGNLSWGDSNHSVTTPLPVNSGTWIPLSVRQSGGGRHANTIAAGGSHSLLIKEDGSLWAMGSGDKKQVHTETEPSYRDRICIEKIPSGNVAQVAASNNHSLFLKEDGSLWAMGYNYYGQLGNGSSSSSGTVLFKVPDIEGVVQVATGDRHSLFIKEDGSLWGMGSYYWGELGTGKDQNNFSQNKTTSARQKSPFKILLEGVVQVAAGGNHSLFIKEDGSLWGMGRNNSGQLGIGNTDGQKIPVQIRASGVVQVTAGTNHSLFIDENGTLWGMGSSSSGQLGIDSNSTPQPIANGVIQVSAGDSHTLYIDENGALWGMGSSSSGQLGIDSNSIPQPIRNGVLQVSAGSNHSLFIDENESLWAMGYNNEGQLGTGNRSNYHSPVRVLEYGLRTGNNLESSRAGISLYAADHFLGRLSSVHDPLFTIPLPLPAHDWPMDDNSTGTNRFDETNASLDLNNSSTLDLTDQNTSGGKTTTFWISPDANSSITLAEHLCLDLNTTLTNQWILQLKDDQNNSVSSDEINASNNNASNNNGWIQISVSHRPDLATDYNRSLAGGSSHSLFIKEDGSLWGMGNNNGNQLGLSNYDYVYTPTQIEDVNLSQVAAGSEHSLFIKKDGSLWGMGYNSYGQLGNGSWSSDLFEIRSSGIVQIAAGEHHSLFIDENGTLWGMGYYFNGQLGHGFDSSNGSSPYRQNTPKEIPAKLPVRRIAAGFSHSLFITADGSLWGMGDNSNGQLGTAKASNQVCPTLIKHLNVSAIAAGASHSLFLEQNGSLYGMGKNTDGQLGDGSTANQSTPVHIADNILSMAAGASHSLFLEQNGSLYGMGLNSSGQLGDGSTANRYSPVHIADNVLSMAAGHNHSIIMKKDGSLWMVGSNSNGQIGDGKSTQYAISKINAFANLNQTATGVNHTLFLQQGGTLFGRGNNTYGQLGTGNSNAVTNQNYVIDSWVSEVAVGESHSLYVKTNGSLWAMGRNLEGQLGADSFGNLYTPTLIRDANISKVVAGDFHSFFLEDNGSLWAMGRNYEGQLGDGTFQNQKKPVLIPDHNVTKVIAGLHHSLFIDSNDTLWGMGDSYYGQLGTGSPETKGTPVQIDTNVSDMATGEYHSLYILNDASKTLMGMGRNYDGQLGAQNTSTQYEAIEIDTNVSSVFAGKNHSLYIKTDGTVWMMGRNTDRQLGNLDANTTAQLESIQLDTDKNITFVTAGDNHTLFLDNNGSLYAAGKNEYSEFGISGYSHPSTPVEVVKFGLKTNAPITDLGAKDHYSLFVDGIIQGSIVSDINFTSSNFSMNFNGFAGKLDDIKIYPHYLTEAEHDESYTRESDPPHTYEFRPRSRPVSLASEEGSFLLDEMRLYPSSLAEEDLTHLFHYELPPLGRDYSTDDWNLLASDSYLPPRKLPAIAPRLNKSSVSQGLFIASWEQNGTLNLSKQKQIANGSLSEIIAGNNDDFYAVGTFVNIFSWGDLNLKSDSSVNSFFTHLESDLQPDWLISPESDKTPYTATKDLFLDTDGYLHATGSFEGNLSMDGKSGQSNGGNDLFYIKMDTFGQVSEIKTYGGKEGNETGIGITADTQGGLILAGYFEGNSSFYDDPTGSALTEGNSDGFYLRYDYLAVIPKQEFEVTVGQNASGKNKYFIDNNESPDLTLIPGLSYQFHLDGNSTIGHPFYFGTSGTGGDNNQSEFITGVENSHEDNGTVILSLDFNPQQPLFYLCGNHSGMGGEIKIPQDDRPRVSLTYAALDEGGENITGGNWTVTDDNGISITSGQDVLVGARVLLSYDPPSYHFFSEWDANVTAENIKSNSIEFLVTEEPLEVNAIASTYSPYPLDLEGNFALNLDDSNISKTLRFSINTVDIIASEGQLEVSIDQNQSGTPLEYRGNFNYSFQDPSKSTIVVTGYQMDENGSWVESMGGGYTMELLFKQVSIPNHQGSYFISYDDRSIESGNWESSNLRRTP